MLLSQHSSKQIFREKTIGEAQLFLQDLNQIKLGWFVCQKEWVCAVISKNALLTQLGQVQSQNAFYAYSVCGPVWMGRVDHIMVHWSFVRHVGHFICAAWGNGWHHRVIHAWPGLSESQAALGKKPYDIVQRKPEVVMTFWSRFLGYRSQDDLRKLFCWILQPQQ